MGLLMLRSRMLSRVWGQVVLPPLEPTWCIGSVSVGVGERPAEAGELAGDGNRDDRAAFAALGVESLPDVV